MAERDVCNFCRDKRCVQIKDGKSVTRVEINKEGMFIGETPKYTVQVCKIAHEILESEIIDKNNYA